MPKRLKPETKYTGAANGVPASTENDAIPAPWVRNYLSRWLDLETEIAGAVDVIGLATGLQGWVLSKKEPQRQFSVTVVVNSRVIARGKTDLHRADISELMSETVNCGFTIPWSEFDVVAISEILGLNPNASFDVRIPDIDLFLTRYSYSEELDEVFLSDCLKYIIICDTDGITEDKLAANEAFMLLGDQTDKDDIVSVSQAITDSGLFDSTYYYGETRGLRSNASSSLAHYILYGEALGIQPNLYFSPIWYTHKYRDRMSPKGALLHYIKHGEKIGNKPCPVFEPKWYLDTYNVNASETLALSHYLANRGTNRYNPNKYFDVFKYVDENKDVVERGIDGFYHWLNWGLFEGREGSYEFSPVFVWQNYLGNNRNINPFETFMDVGLEFGWKASPRGTGTTVHRQVAINSMPGPLFEARGPKIETATFLTKIVALYLPQFHTIPENDLWWGAGFTEWRNIPRGLPRFEGHIQPRIPRDLGFYTLEGSGILRRQIELARHSGVHGFCFYYYNFNGHRLLERPLETFLAEQDIDFPFCIMWANENWSRRWDGSDDEVLIHQDYRHEDLVGLIDDIARHMIDPRYMRTAEGRPLFFVYRADVIPDCQITLAAWRERFRAAHDLDPVIVMSQSFGVEDPRPLGFDGAIEFPPHKLSVGSPALNPSLRMFDPDFIGDVKDYASVIQESLATQESQFPLIKTAFPSWDNDARRQGHGLSIANSTPKAFQDWLRKLFSHAIKNTFYGESIVFVNAWNEWCEGAYLEPDTHFGYAYINAIGRAILSLQSDFRRIVLIGHDAFPSGAQHLLLHMGETFSRVFGMEVRFALLGGGEMVPRYREIAKTFVASEEEDPWQALRAHLTDLRASGFDCALTNTAAAGGATTILEELEFSFCSLVHELPTLIRSSVLEPSYAEITKRAKAVVYPSHYVKESLDRVFGASKRPPIVRPQGLYHRPDVPADARETVREEFALGSDDKIVLNLGYADLRKGVDLFVGLAEQVALLDPNTHFVWVGGVHPDIRPWLDLDLQQRRLRNVHFKSFTKDVGRYLGAADLFLLTSREDPFPSVVLEAIAVGLPVAAFENSGGHVELLGSDPILGALLPFGAAPEGARRIVELLGADERAKESAAYRRDLIAHKFDFAHYCSDLLRLIEPRYRSVSVIVPSYNYARYMRERLRSIFAQTYPVLEIIVLDDASADDSVEVAASAANEAGRTIVVDRRETNSGNTFRQWKAGLDRARGEFVWIAEADDSSAPKFLRESMRRLTENPDAAFCFSDSCAIGSDGEIVFDNYKDYYRQLGDDGLDQDSQFEGRDFLRRFLTIRNLVVNVSSAVWRTENLREAFASLGDEAFSLTCAGDWRIYLEVCLRAKTVLYAAAPLNLHRRHDHSVTHMLDKQDHFDEVVSVQEVALAVGGNDAELANSVAAFRTELQQLWRLERTTA